jgi:hypothetical protein
MVEFISRFTCAEHIVETAPRANRPAWIASAIVHCLVVLLLAFSWRDSPPISISERARPVSIVIAARADDNQATRYLDEDSVQDASDNSAAVDLRAALPDATTFTDGVLDAESDRLSVGPAVVGNDLFDRLDLDGTGRGKRRLFDDAVVNVKGDEFDGEDAPVGESARTQLFGIEAEGHSFVFVIDRSHSMGEETGALHAAERELVSALSNLRENHHFQIVAYNDKRRYFNRDGMVPAHDHNKERAAEFLAGLVASSGTKHELPLLLAAEMKPDVVFLFTDATHPPLSESQLRRVTAATGQRTVIHCVQFGTRSEAEASFMPRLAKLNRGRFVYVNTSRIRSP